MYDLLRHSPIHPFHSLQGKGGVRSIAMEDVAEDEEGGEEQQSPQQQHLQSQQKRGAAAAPPPPQLTPQQAARILGAQANLWTEYVPDAATAEYMLLPRLTAMAEALWSPPEGRHWPGFLARLRPLLAQLERLGYRGRALDTAL